MKTGHPMSSWRSHGVLGRVNTHEAPEGTRADLDVALRAAVGAVSVCCGLMAYARHRRRY